MRLITANITANCDIALHGDTHWGNLASSQSGLEKTLDWIRAERHRYFIHMGDAVEAITTDDKRFHGDSATEAIPMRQVRAVVETYKPIRKYGLAWLMGNHEFALQRFGDVSQDMAEQLDIPYGGCGAKILLRDKRGPIAKLYLCHPSRFALRSNAKDFEQRRANMMAAVKRFLVDKASDCLIMAVGHTHRLLVVPPTRKLTIYDDGKKLCQDYLEADHSGGRYIDPDRRWYVNTGSYLRTMILGADGYAERAGYDPVELGFAIVEIRDRKIVNVIPRIVD